MKNSSTLLLCMALLLAASCATTGQDNENMALAHYKLGISYLNDERIQQAFLEFQTALQFDKKNHEIYNALGFVYLKLEELDKAEESFKRAIALKESFSDAYNNLCHIYYIQKKYEAAVGNCKAALENPMYATPEKAFYNLGRSYYRLGRFDEAIEAYKSGIRRFPTFYPAYYGLALTYNAKGMYGEASTAITKAIEIDPLINGDRKKAESRFKSPQALEEESQDFKNLLDILKY